MLRKVFTVMASLHLGLALAALAQPGKTWKLGGIEEFSKGKLEGLSLLSTGELRLAPELEQIEGINAGFVWDIEAAPGGILYIGTGSPAAVYRLEKDKAVLLHKTSEVQVLSVLPLADGSVLAATAPRGIIFKIDPEGQVTIFAQLDESYVWDMRPGPSKDILCATGPNGRLLKLNEKGEVAEVFKAAQKHLMCLAVDPEGNMFVGTEPEGLIYHVRPSGEQTILYDAPETEIHTLAIDGEGVLYAGTAQREAGARKTPPGPEAAGVQVPSGGPGAQNTASALRGQPQSKNSVYKIVPGRGAVQLAQFDRMFVLSLSLDEGGHLLAGTGVDGRLYGIEEMGRTTLLTELKVAELSAMARGSKGTVHIGTSNPGGLWRLKSTYRSSGSFVSEVFDASYISQWGRVCWKGEVREKSTVRVSLRTGNSSKHDATWTDWSASVTEPSGRRVELAPGRFAQIRAELESWDGFAAPLLYEVCASYLQVNRRPHVRELKIDGARPEGGDAESPRQQKKPLHQKTITWKATDPNGDKLVFDLYFRSLAEREWRELKAEITRETRYTWDTERVPDGHYLIRLVASDRASRPSDETLADEEITRPILVDNTRPQVVGLESERQIDGTYIISGRSEDSYSNIARIQISHNSADWRPVFPVDGMLDSPQEAFSFRTEELSEGEHVFVVAAADESRNIGSSKIVVTVETSPGAQ